LRGLRLGLHARLRLGRRARGALGIPAANGFKVLPEFLVPRGLAAAVRVRVPVERTIS
jgi:hypothetical protein